MAYRPPGQVTKTMHPHIVMMICTAGHVDHGKTALVRLLTGCETDRLKEEKERGLTIELGFAPCYLGGDMGVGIVDVPGHEKFIKNMVAGVSGIELAILVIAADDGIMPQTEEHLHIMELLGIKHGMVALTKIDLATRERIKTLTHEIQQFLEGTFMENAPIFPVSSVTFDGYQDFYNGLVDTIKGIIIRRARGIFRLPIERIFSQQGFGAIITGIAVAGTIKVGDQVEIVPGHQTGRIRGMQCFAHDAESGGEGQCLALNIPDCNRTPIERGQVLSIPGYIKEATIFHINLKTVPHLTMPIRNAEEIKFHTGTSEKPGKIYLLESGTLESGQTGLATVVIIEPVAASKNDHVIIRRPSPAETIAGGEIIAMTYGEQRPRKQVIIDKIHTYLDFFNNIDMTSEEGEERKILYALREELINGASLRDISIATLLPVEVVKEHLQRMSSSGSILPLTGDYYVHTERYSHFLEEAERTIEAAVSSKDRLKITSGDLRKTIELPSIVWDRIEQDLAKSNRVKKAGNAFILPEAADKMSAADKALISKIMKIYEDSGFETPRPDELPQKLNAGMQKIEQLLEYLINEGRIIKLSKNVLLSYSNFKKAQDMVIDTIQTKGTLDSGDFKFFIKSSRKYALAILDYLDARGVTMRQGNERKLASDFKKRLL